MSHCDMTQEIRNGDLVGVLVDTANVGKVVLYCYGVLQRWVLLPPLVFFVLHFFTIRERCPFTATALHMTHLYV